LKKVKEIYRTISTKPIIVSRNIHIKEVVKMLLEDPITRSVYVVDDGKIVGIITVLHLLKVSGYRFFGIFPKPENVLKDLEVITAKTAEEVMMKPLWVTPETPISDALKIMIDNDVQELPVVDETGRIMGDLSSLEVLNALWRE